MCDDFLDHLINSPLNCLLCSANFALLITSQKQGYSCFEILSFGCALNHHRDIFLAWAHWIGSGTSLLSQCKSQIMENKHFPVCYAALPSVTCLRKQGGQVANDSGAWLFNILWTTLFQVQLSFNSNILCPPAQKPL